MSRDIEDMTDAQDEARTARAAGFIDRALRASLPLGVPPPYTRMVSARWTGAGRKRVAEADLTMFDGQPAKVRVWRYGSYPDALAHTFHDLPGGDVSYEDGRWIRIDPATLEPVRAQLEMFNDDRPYIPAA